MTEGRRSRWDAAIYSGSAIAAAGVALAAGIPIFRTWGRLAVGPYAAGAIAGALLALRRPPRPALRVWLAATVLAGAAVAPLVIEATRRVRTDPGLHAQSEVIITEEGAMALVHGRNPYEVDYLEGPLVDRPVATKTHFPYPPGMLLFGLPRAAFGHHVWTDARVWFLAATAVVLAVAMSLLRASSIGDRLRIVQWLLVVPTGALLVATEGHDLAVIALLLLGTILVRDRRLVGAGLVAGLAVAIKQTALVVVPFLLVAAAVLPGSDPAGSTRGRGRVRRAARMLGPALAVVAAVVTPFVVWGPRPFLEDAILFPLGFGTQENPNSSPSIGRALVAAFPSAEGAITLALGAIAVAVSTWLLFRPIPDTAAAVRRAGLAFLVIMALLPAVRIGYLAYPINLFAWGWLLDRGRRSGSSDKEGAARPPGVMQWAGER